MRLSIITVSLYCDDELFKTLKSVNETFSLFMNKSEVEHVIVCSEKMEYADEGNRKYICAYPKGIYNAMNIGLNSAVGEWVWFLNAGDECINGIGAELLQIMSVCNAGVIKSGIESIKNGISITVYGKIVSPHPGTFYKRRILSGAGGFREDYKVISDRIMFDRLMMKRIKMYQSKLVVARFYENGISSGGEGKDIKIRESLRYALKFPVSPLRWYRYFKEKLR
jgi:glycosyltransferase involved in cell wall biosynthesis